MRRTIHCILLLLAGLGPMTLRAAERPRLVVNIVVGSMRAGDLERYSENFCNGGFRRLMEEGIRFTDSHYDYQRTSTPVSLATLTTGAMPYTHGVTGYRWIEYTDNSVTELIVDRRVTGLNHADDNFSPQQLIAPTLGEALQAESPASRVVTVAMDPVSAVIMGGKCGEVYWLERGRNEWTSSTWYMSMLPASVRNINQYKFNSTYLFSEWSTLLYRDQYVNTRYSDVRLTDFKSNAPARRSSRQLRVETEYNKLLLTPAGNTALLALAKALIYEESLGSDAAPDLLNICLDTSRCMNEAYGPESVEVEDMYYRLDRALEDLFSYLDTQLKPEHYVVMLTSDHGTSPAADPDSDEEETRIFNGRQAEVLVNSFLNARYGTGDWVLGYEEGAFFLNHNLVYAKGLNLNEIQEEVAVFALQLRGVSHAHSALSLRTSSFGSGYARRMQNSFYPRRSGDVLINLMPGWIEQQEGTISSSGSMYGYDTHVPLLFCGRGIPRNREVHRRVDMTQVAPTLAALLGIEAPAAAEGAVLQEIFEK